MNNKYLKYFISVVYITYVLKYVYDEFHLGGVTTGLYIIFNVPLGIIGVLSFIYWFNKGEFLEKVISIVGILCSIAILISKFLF